MPMRLVRGKCRVCVTIDLAAHASEHIYVDHVTMLQTTMACVTLRCCASKQWSLAAYQGQLSGGHSRDAYHATKRHQRSGQFRNRPAPESMRGITAAASPNKD
eukprot:3909382-Amphidinium_carterae.2